MNLALNQPASVSSYQDSGSTGSNAVDGDYATLWKTAKVSGKNKPPSEWITIDLGTNATVGRVVLEWDAYYATQYTIQVSADSTSWSTVYAVSGGDGGNDTLDFSQTSARYVKLETTGWNNSSFRDWLQEIEIYAGNGVPAPSPTPSPTPAPSPTPTATPPPSGGGSLHIGDLDGSGTSVNRKNWSASVTVVVHDANENLISGVTVSGAWSSGVSGGTSCVTGGSGSCVIASGNINKNIGSAVFSVIDASSSGFTYDAASNHDPDGDSDGSSILIPSP